jgi:two-component system response regulator AtoC
MEENGTFIHCSEKMQEIQMIIDQLADTDVTVLIQGESGVGKEVVARSIHLNSSHRENPFVKVNCAALPQELLESELFGYEKGAFTGAYCQKPGKFELAEGGAIFLDEIVEIPLPLQAKLLQVLQDKEFPRLGGRQNVRVSVRILAATNKNIEESVKKGQFREDLYYRLNVVNISIPPLRERREEIPILVEHFLSKHGMKYNKKVDSLSGRAMQTLLEHHWLGNIRELENIIQRYVVFGNERVIIDGLVPLTSKDFLQEGEAENLPKREGLSQKKRFSLRTAVGKVVMEKESKLILDTLELTRWNRKEAAMMLNINYRTLMYKIKKYGLKGQFSSIREELYV